MFYCNCHLHTFLLLLITDAVNATICDNLVLALVLNTDCCCGIINEIQGPLVEHCKNTLMTFFGDDPQTSHSFGRIINNRHFKYVTSLAAHLCCRCFI